MCELFFPSSSLLSNLFHYVNNSSESSCQI